MVLGGEAGVCEVAINMAPFFGSSIIEHLEFVCDDKGDDAVCKTFWTLLTVFSQQSLQPFMHFFRRAGIDTPNLIRKDAAFQF